MLFKLVEVVNGVEQTPVLVENQSFSTIPGSTLYTATIPKNTTTYRNYRTSICASNNDLSKNCTKSRSKTLEAGLLRYGEMFAALHGIGYNAKTTTYNTLASRPSINLSSEVKILSGTGLPNDPYIVGL